MNVILRGVVGSTAYGLATPNSDIDRLGVFQARTSELLGLHPPKESRVSTDPDVTHHELGKFVRLCLKNNPTVMELLWLDEYEVMTQTGDDLIAIRECFLSQRIRNTYGGYARQQWERLNRRQDGSFASDLRKRTEKHGRHCMRLILQGAHALRTGQLLVRLSDNEVRQCREAGELAASDVGAFGTMVEDEMAAFDAIDSVLPEEPDESIAERLLLIARTTDLGTY